jgi:hypothetical protein
MRGLRANCIEPPAIRGGLATSPGALPGYARPAFAVNEPLPASAAAGAALTQARGRGKLALGTVLRQAIVDGGEQRVRRERLAQTARRTELQRHPEEIRGRRIQIANA